jgi:hypothetical protein
VRLRVVEQISVLAVGNIRFIEEREKYFVLRNIFKIQMHSNIGKSEDDRMIKIQTLDIWCNDNVYLYIHI